MAEQLAFTCTRWRRYGHDRLYVEDVRGVKVGYRDLKTGVDHADNANDLSLLGALAEEWVASRGGDVPATLAPDSPAELETPWTDLSQTSPGQAVIEQATAHAHAGLDARSWRLGAYGEARVADELVRLWSKNHAWTAIHSIRIGMRGADIDHLVLGPGGVFAVNTKNHRRANVWVGGESFWVNGARTHHIRNSRHEADRVGSVLSTALGEHVPVWGLIVLVDPARVTIRTPPEPGVIVIDSRALTRWLLGLPAVHDQSLLNRVWDVARRSTTWDN